MQMRVRALEGGRIEFVCVCVCVCVCDWDGEQVIESKSESVRKLVCE